MKIHDLFEGKGSKEEAGYIPRPKDGEKCINCTMWRDPNKCTAVAGNISPNGWCEWYAGGAYGKRGKRVNEAEGLGLTIFDIDETLMRTTAKIKVVKDGQVIKSLTNQEFNNYKLQPGEQFDFGEFKNAEKFRRESEPIAPMIAKLKAILRNAGDSKVIMLTARADFDDKETFLNTFRDLGIDMSRVHVHRAGNLPGNPAENKAVWIRKYLDTGKYSRVRLYDDSMGNIRMFNNLAKEYPNVKFFPYLVTHEGGIKTVREITSKPPIHIKDIILPLIKRKKDGEKYINYIDGNDGEFLVLHDNGKYMELSPKNKEYLKKELGISEKVMFTKTSFHEDGRIVKGVNTTVDVGPDEIKTQAAKFGNTVDRDGFPPTLSKKVKGKSTNVLYNLGLVEDTEPRYTAREWAIIEGGHSLEQPTEKKPGKLFTMLNNIANEKEIEPHEPGYQHDILTMPANTVVIDTPGELDWYKIGQHFPTLGREDPHEYGQSESDMTITFNSPEEMANFIKVASKLGLTIKSIGGSQEHPEIHSENFADGKNPGRKGLSKRMGINTKASVSSLRKTAKNSSGEKQRMAHWLANMKAGKKK